MQTKEKFTYGGFKSRWDYECHGKEIQREQKGKYNEKLQRLYFALRESSKNQSRQLDWMGCLRMVYTCAWTELNGMDVIMAPF